MYVCMYVCVYVCMYVCMYACMHVWMYVCMCVCFFNNLFTACSITLLCNTKCLFYPSHLCCFNYFYTLVCNCPFHNLSKSIEFINWAKYFMYLFTSSLFSLGQVSCFTVFLTRTSLSLCNFGHSYIRWSTVWLPPPHVHSEESIILNLCK